MTPKSQYDIPSEQLVLQDTAGSEDASAVFRNILTSTYRDA